MRQNEISGTVMNEMKLVLPSLSVNEGTARAVVAAFCAQLNPTATEIADIKCQVPTLSDSKEISRSTKF